MTQVAFGSFMGPKIISFSKDCNNIIRHISAARHSVANNCGKKLFMEESFSNLKYIGHWTVASLYSEKLMSLGLGTFRIRLFIYLKVKS
jgi:hypothetical protein